VDARADVYSLGCVLFECLTGRPPFDREGDLKVVFAHLNEPPPLVTAFRPDLPEAVDEVLGKALAKAPDERFSTSGELVPPRSERGAPRRGADGRGDDTADDRRRPHLSDRGHPRLYGVYAGAWRRGRGCAGIPFRGGRRRGCRGARGTADRAAR